MWMPCESKISYATLKILGVKATGYFIGIFSKYQLEVPSAKKFFKSEVLKVEKDANKRDSTYWEALRPIPLTELEVQDYVHKDSCGKVQDTPMFKDSLDKRDNKFNPLSIITGYTYSRSKWKFNLSTNNIQDFVNYNTVEGVNAQIKLNMNKEMNHERLLFWGVAGRYGFGNGHLNLKGNLGYQINNLCDASDSCRGREVCGSI
jgi:hypothetical protein